MWACLARIKSDLTGWTLSPGLGFFILDRLANIAAGDDPEDREDEERDTLDDEADEEEKDKDNGKGKMPNVHHALRPPRSATPPATYR